jgi:hypothetical protein
MPINRSCTFITAKLVTIPSHQVRQLSDFIESNGIEVLNVAGPRESNEPGVYRFTLQLLQQYWQQYRS